MSIQATLNYLILKLQNTMNNLQLTFAANISYSGLTYNTRLLVEYKHTGKQFFTKKKGQNYNTCTTDEDIANGWIQHLLNMQMIVLATWVFYLLFVHQKANGYKLK